jgi:tetratricopeptide (TPR) repeat protein
VFFALISALCYLRAWPDPRPGSCRLRWLGASIAAFTLALLTYPIVLTDLLALVALDWWRLQRGNARQGSPRDPAARRVWWTIIPFVLVTALFLALALSARWNAGGIWTKPQGVEAFGLAGRAAQAFHVWACYLWKWFLPFDLSPVYTDLVWFNPTEAPFVLSASFVVGLTGLLIWRRRQWPGALALWLAYLALLIPVLGLTEHPHMASDRYCIFAHVVVAIAMGAALVRLWEITALRRRTLVACTGIALAFGTLAWRQALVWKDTESLFRHVLAKLPENRYRCDIYWRYGIWLLREGRSEEAEQCHLAALRIAPDYANPYESLGELRARRGQWQEAIAFHQKALELNPGFGPALDSLAWLRATAPDDALRDGAEALRRTQALVNGSAQPDPIYWRTHASALAETGQFAKAIETAEAARRLALAIDERDLATVLEKMLNEFRAGRPYRLRADQGERRR